MTERKRNEYLESEESQSEGPGYDSEAVEESRISHASKRRKTFHGRHSDDDSLDNGPGPDPEDEEANEGEEDRHGAGKVSTTFLISPEQGEIDSLQPHKRSKNTTRQAESSSKTRSKGKLHKPKTGVIYLSRIPPFMKPATLKQFLEPYGTITRTFLTPEDASSRTSRVRRGGNKRHMFVDGWVEFLHKSDAKIVAETLNAKIIGGKKGGFYHDDIWNMRYLKGFKWKDLTEQIKNENAERASRLRMEIAQTTKENKRFVERVEKGKMLERMEGKRKRKNGPESNTEARDLDISKDTSGGIPNAQAQWSKTSTKASGKKPSQGMDAKTVLDMVL